MKKLIFDNSTYIWKTKLNLCDKKNDLINLVNNIINSSKNINNDAYGLIISTNNEFDGTIDIKNEIDLVTQYSIDNCKELYTNETKSLFNKINIETWINVVKSVNPTQRYRYGSKKMYHTHSEINKQKEMFIPTYTFVYYLQMPNIMNDEDGVLYFIGENQKEYWYRPCEDDLIVMNADIPHAPNDAPNSTTDRVVIAGNIGFEYLKKQKTIL
jgi:hypothetical protein